MTFKQFILFTFSLCLATNASSAANNERWFEVEVILFSQLDDKSTLKESFHMADAATPMPKYKKVIDLLGPYLQPDIASLKSLIPSCEISKYPEHFIIQASKLTPLFVEQSLEALNQQAIEESEAFGMPIEAAALNTTSIDGDNIDASLGLENTLQSENQTKPSNTSITGTLATNTLATNQNGTVESHIEAFNDSNGLSAEQIALVEQAEIRFAEIKFFEKNNLVSQGLSKNTKQPLCRLPETYFSEIANQDPTFSYNGFTVKAMPTTIDNAENQFSKQPYLLGKDSLMLHDIVKQLKLSKNFRPLLHMGFRHAPKDKKYAEAYRIVAGDNLEAHYQQAQNSYLDEVEKKTTDTLTNDINDLPAQYDDEIQSLALQEQAIEAAISEKLAQVIQQSQNVNESNLTEIQRALDTPDSLLTFLPDEAAINVATPPEKPLQPWYVDGLFRVHLNHYLYITADFSIMNATLAQQATHALTSSEPLVLKPIRFQQNKRVISGEIHYFDHPYIGMVVQIRKHKRPELTEQ